MVFLPNSHSVPFAVCCEGCQGIALFGIGTIYIYIFTRYQEIKVCKDPSGLSGQRFQFLENLTMVYRTPWFERGFFTCEDTQQDQDNVMGQISLYSLLTDIHLEPFFFQKNRFPHLKPSKNSTLRTF